MCGQIYKPYFMYSFLKFVDSNYNLASFKTVTLIYHQHRIIYFKTIFIYSIMKVYLSHI